MLIPWRAWGFLALFVAICASGLLYGHRQYVKGGEKVQKAWNADIAIRTAAALKASEAARATEQTLQTKVAKVDHDFQAQKTLRVAADKRSADSLQRLNAALATAANTDTAPASGTDGADPRGIISGECARALITLDAAYAKLADKASALQQYTLGVRLTP